MKSVKLLCASVCCLSISYGVQAAVFSYSSIPGVFSTGVDNSGNPLSVGTVDPHWVTSASPTGPGVAKATDLNISFWAGNTATSQWINGTGSSADNPPAGTYVYTTTFSLFGFDPSTAAITGQWASDNESTIYLNGVNTGFTHSTPLEMSFFNNFSLTSGFVAGQNTLSFVVTQDFSNATNPEGLQVNILSAVAAVPEPSASLLFGISGLAWMAARSLRTRKIARF